MTWLWHTLFDGTRLCRCGSSRRLREARWAAEIRRNWT